MNKNKRYLTQCDSGGTAHQNAVRFRGAAMCPEMAHLDKPARWRCPTCVKKYGPLPESNDA